MDVTGLTPDHEYKFRVAAVNAEGESEPLETEGTIIAKNPFGKQNVNYLNIYYFKLLIIYILCTHFEIHINNVGC